MPKKPFHIKFPDRSVIIVKKDYQKHDGLLHKSYDNTVAYLEKYAPSKVQEYKTHVENFDKKFDNILKNTK